MSTLSFPNRQSGHEDHAPQPSSGRSRSLSLRHESTMLTPQQMEDRSLICRSSVARPDVDAFRELRTRLLAMTTNNFVALVAPVSAGCGGSFVARNLAAAMAFDETKTALLIDCDLRHPSQHATMHIEPVSGGLIDYLENPDDERGELSFESVLYQTGVPGLNLMPAGAMREAGIEYFSSVRMRLMLDSIRSRHPDCYMFLDSPPVLGSPEARILADLADIVVLVAGYGRNTPQAIAQAAANFDPEKFAGVVFNQGV
ncbi:P-loop NTPase family protein [Marilutibacter alkalisoli]|uniref:Polysaccharide biosynthesis protein n=1 Tax=Marilutibacter alkalisoli TaxID=2591633 RepID=A0A514BQT3_9GAMM|nr:CpsD/CapB family tyrosine-protein kinase [Lysobacter alkalisoli]QDH69758.1 polysaccharide biosynthesis protein [Lysobacter alkalisoli]